MAVMFAFEDFAEPAPVADPQVSRDWQEGYDAGVAATRAEHGETQAQLSQEVIQALSDITFGFAEARLHVLAGLEPLFRALVNRILPAALADAFPAHIVSRLLAAAKTDISQPFRVLLHPTQIDAINDILPEQLAALLTVEASSSLSPHTAMIDGPTAETALDHDALLTELSESLSALFDHITESRSHG